MTVTFHPAARAELSEAVAFYNERVPGLGDAFAGEFRATLLRTLRHPDAGFPVRPQIQRRLVPRFPYSVLYALDNDRLHVLAIMHHSREPTRWEDRL